MQDNEVRKVIREALQKLATDLEQFEQTTHGVLSTGTIEEVCGALCRCHWEPSAYTVSSLSQTLDKYLEAGAAGEG